MKQLAWILALGGIVFLSGACGAAGACCGPDPAQDKARNAAAESEEFFGGVAERLVDRFREGLLAADPRRALADFDRQTPAYLQVADDLPSLFRRYDSLRIYTHLLGAEENGTRGVATVEFTMEARPVTGNQPAVRHSAQLRFTGEREGKNWKIVELEPRDFFANF